MWTGRQTLASIEDAITQLHGEESELDRALGSAIHDVERLRTERSQALRELARVKLDEMTANRLVTNLDAGERRALQVLHGYRSRMTAAAEKRAAMQKEVMAAEAARHAAATVVEQALEAVDCSRSEAEAKAQDSQAWRDAKAERDKAAAIAAEAESKAAASAAELGAKKKPYDEDPLFVYLWQRRFGTAQYAAGNIARILDRLVAKSIGYHATRPNYAALIEIPLRLKEHASAKKKVVEQLQAALAAIAQQAMIESGVDARGRALAEARHKMAALDDTVEKKRDILREFDAAHADLVAGATDPAYNEALNTIAAADAEDSIAGLYAEARRTPTGADEGIVGRLDAIDRALASTEAQIAQLRRRALDLSRRRSDMDEVRGRFRRTGYDHPQSTFGNDGDIGGVLKNVLEGVVRSGVLWDALRQGHQSRPTRGSVDFGSSGLPFPFPIPGGGMNDARGGEWRDPSSQGGWLPGPAGSAPDDERFRTDGSF